ncbi:nuclear transport factor 2 family protein [Olleya sp. ITB9]|uniref:nuclear transport factor 2 family protein n=1 Tax=Olleya sp. ITB9 TaxID=1715648 RepID=UPI0006D10DD4|nr:nuclear transport factor 2 family protein [Olleya sp. ITB9]
MKHIAISIIVVFSFLSCNTKKNKANNALTKQAINMSLDAWHDAAANADFDAYFESMTSDAIFIGTDATENWTLNQFKDYSKPYFDKGKAWSFKALQRNVFLNEDNTLAWFDELLDTQMEICRGSGVMVFKDNQWKIQHYVLSITIPNSNVKTIVNLKKQTDSITKQILNK